MVKIGQAVWALGNVAGDSPKCRDLVLSNGALIPLLSQFNENAKLSMLRNATWTLSNFCRGKPQPHFEQVNTHKHIHAHKGYDCIIIVNLRNRGEGVGLYQILENTPQD